MRRAGDELTCYSSNCESCVIDFVAETFTVYGAAHGLELAEDAADGDEMPVEHIYIAFLWNSGTVKKNGLCKPQS